MKSDIKEKIGARIRELRIAKGIKQCQLADMLNMERSHLTRIENGKHRPSDDNMEKIAKTLGVEIKDIFDFEHIDTQENLLKQINERLLSNPSRIEDFYKIIMALTK